jgi:hypothetical protein
MRLRNLLVGITLLAAVAWFLAYNSANPVVRGRRLTAWIEEFDIWQGPSSPAARALTAAGPRAEPLLMRMLERRETSVRVRLRRWLFRQYGIRLSFRPTSILHQRALDVCNLLCQDAGSAAPAVTKLVNEFPSASVNNTTADYALNTLAVLGTNGIAGLIQALTNRSVPLQIRAAQLLGTAPGSGSGQIIQALRANLNHPDPNLRQASTLSLEFLERRPEPQPPFPPHLSEAPAPELSDRPPSVWDHTSGTRVISNSGLYPGCRPEDLFGARLSSVGTPETGSAIFQDSTPDGFVHFVEWETPAPVVVHSFGLLAAHETALNAFIRACRGFRLYARSTVNAQFDLLYSEDLTVPYGSGYGGGFLARFRNLMQPVTAQQFRIEFIQNGTGVYHGTRAVELYGFATPLTRPLILQALENQEPVIRDSVVRLLP